MAYICNNNKPFVTESQKPSHIRLKKHRPPHLGGCPCKTFSMKEQVKMDSAAKAPLYPPSFPTIRDRPGQKKKKTWPTASSSSSSKFLHFLIPNLFSKKALLPKEDVRPECSANRSPSTQKETPILKKFSQFSSVAQSCPTLCDPMNHSMPGLPVHYQLPEFTQTHIHRVSDAIQPSHPLSSPSPPSPSPSQHQSLFQWVNSSHEVAKVLEFQL